MWERTILHGIEHPLFYDSYVFLTSSLIAIMQTNTDIHVIDDERARVCGEGCERFGVMSQWLLHPGKGPQDNVYNVYTDASTVSASDQRSLCPHIPAMAVIINQPDNSCIGVSGPAGFNESASRS